MAAQIVQNPGVQNRGAQDNPPHHEERYPSGDAHSTLRKRVDERTPAGREQNPELLQWRANVLLDEMMLGAVDIAANDTVAAAPTRPGYNSRAADLYDEPASRRTVGSTETHPAVYPTHYANGIYHEDRYSAATNEQTERLSPSDPHNEWARPAWHFAEPTVPSSPPPPPMTPSARAVALQEHTRHHQTPVVNQRNTSQTAVPPDVRTTAVGAPASSTGAAGKNAPGKKDAEQWVFAAEQRYQQIAARQQAPAPVQGGNGRTGASASGPTAGWVDPVDALFDDFTANTYGVGSHTGTEGQMGGRPRVTQTGRRSNLLPRMSNLDPRALQQEMVLLQTEIEQALPAGHESRERALHLLQKAYTILHADASRSAEVDYYLQQVRTIGQRVQETLRWSNLYHSRLTLYLSAWVTLSLIVITARYAYHNGLVVALANMSGAEPADALLPHNLLTMFTAFFAGALGGALGVFINMRHYTQSKQGFFDRKYSLRGLILPLIGGIVGLILCLFLGLFYYLFGADPATNLLLGALPALLACAFGIVQDFIYGTRN